MGNNGRPETPGAQEKQREHGAVDGDQKKASESLISVSGTECQRGQNNRQDPAFGPAEYFYPSNKISPKSSLLTNAGRYGKKYPENSFVGGLGQNQFQFAWDFRCTVLSRSESKVRIKLEASRKAIAQRKSMARILLKPILRSPVCSR